MFARLSVQNVRRQLCYHTQSSERAAAMFYLASVQGDSANLCRRRDWVRGACGSARGRRGQHWGWELGITRDSASGSEFAPIS